MPCYSTYISTIAPFPKHHKFSVQKHICYFHIFLTQCARSLYISPYRRLSEESSEAKGDLKPSFTHDVQGAGKSLWRYKVSDSRKFHIHYWAFVLMSLSPRSKVLSQRCYWEFVQCLLWETYVSCCCPSLALHLIKLNQ